MNAFEGFPPGLFAFFADLERDNSKAFWEANKHRWEHDVRDPLRALLEELAVEFGPLRMFRPHRDMRFSKGDSPYEPWAGATSESRAVGGIGYHVEVSATRLVAGYGAMAMSGGQLRRFRAAVDHETSGQEFETLHRTLASRSFPLSPGIDPPLKTAPRGYTADHPRIEFLRWKGAAVVREWGEADWVHTPRTLDVIRDVWRGTRPLKDWLDAHVGQPEEPDRSRR